MELERTPDILRAVAEAKQTGLLVIGFAAETENVLANAREKFTAKNLDAIVANDVTQEGAGFDTLTNEVTIISSRPKVADSCAADGQKRTSRRSFWTKLFGFVRVKPTSQPVMQASGKACI